MGHFNVLLHIPLLVERGQRGFALFVLLESSAVAAFAPVLVDPFACLAFAVVVAVVAVVILFVTDLDAFFYSVVDLVTLYDLLVIDD